LFIPEEDYFLGGFCEKVDVFNAMGISRKVNKKCKLKCKLNAK
jgi:hypothetical protein